MVIGLLAGAAKKICATKTQPKSKIEAATVTPVANNSFTTVSSRVRIEPVGLTSFNLPLVFGEIDLDPAFHLPEKPGEGIFSWLRGEIGFAGVIESAGIVFKFF